ncbi:hypothetical protein LJB84_00135 [Bacteroidales bacterium OttesenSCG-928-J19]|nr:hypothetical protein [Bacteroidales bacterium OttesenSCG-928-J19]
MKRITTLLFALLSFCLITSAQDSFKGSVYLKNGTIREGEITELTSNKTVTVQTTNGNVFIYEMKDIKKITEERFVDESQGSIYLDEIAKPKTFRALIDMGYTLGLGELKQNRGELSLSAGAQFSSIFFAGVGAGVHLYGMEKDFEAIIPLFVDIRVNFINGRVSPFLGMKGGYSFHIAQFNEVGAYFTPTIGVRFRTSQDVAVNVSIGYSCQNAKVYYYDGYSIYGPERRNLGGISLKLGFEI